MPLTNIQSDILRLLASHRDPESYVAGSTPLNREERVARAAEQDPAFLQENGYVLRWLRRDPLIYTVLAERTGETTKLERVVNSDFRATMTRLRELLSDAEAFVTRMPTDNAGLLLFLKDGNVVQPDPARLQDYQTHAGQRRGQWPTSVEISAAMLERYNQSPNPPKRVGEGDRK